MQALRKLLFLLSANEKKRAGLLLIMIFIMALLDALGVASILPFMAVLTNIDLIETNPNLKNMFQVSSMFGVKNTQQFLFVLGFLVFILLIISLIFKTLTTYLQVRFVQMSEYSIAKKLIEGYMRQPYSWFLSRNSADLGKNILSEVQHLISTGMRPMMELIAKSMITIVLIILLIIVNPKLTLIIGLSLGGSYWIIFFFIKKYLKQIGENRLKSNELRFKAASEAFGAIKEIIVGGLEKAYIKNFSSPAKVYASSQASSQVASLLPRFLLEAIAFGGILLLIFYLFAKSGNFNDALPIISLYVFAGYRMMPGLQQIYFSSTQLTFVGPSLDKLYDDIKSLKTFKENQDLENLFFEKTIELKNIHYNYSNSSQVVLKDISLTIPAKSSIGFIGSTGSGKTTIIDIILGLLEAKKGNLEIDGKVITKQNTRSWQNLIGYVPQQIYLADDSIAKNIAFGHEREYINQKAVENAAKIANLHDFVINELPNQYETIVGERGVRLSGGQRQRIGIARALYYNPKVLILDEATSGLDSLTEKMVMDNLNKANKDITIIMIAHRLNTVKNCDIIFKLEKGKLVGQGTYEELVDGQN